MFEQNNKGIKKCCMLDVPHVSKLGGKGISIKAITRSQ